MILEKLFSPKEEDSQKPLRPNQVILSPKNLKGEGREAMKKKLEEATKRVERSVRLQTTFDEEELKQAMYRAAILEKLLGSGEEFIGTPDLIKRLEKDGAVDVKLFNKILREIHPDAFFLNEERMRKKDEEKGRR